MHRSNNSQLICSSSERDQRRGAAQVIIAIMLFVFAVMSAYMIDYAYMLLIKGQARMVADSAARAGAEALVRTRDPNLAIQAAMDIGGRNEVAGRPFQLAPSDIVLGQSIAASDGSWVFSPGVTPFNSVQVTSRVRRDSPFGAAPLFFGGVTGVDDFQTRGKATAGEQPIEICLCLDRSNSMMQEALVSGKWTSHELMYPVSLYGFNTRVCLQHSPPHPRLSRWVALRSALDIFFTECGNAVNPPRVALVTFSSNVTMKLHPLYSYSASDVNVQMPTGSGVTWSQNLTQLRSAIEWLSSRPLFGETNTNTGLQAAVNVCTGAVGRVQARKVIILITDGIHDSGFSPIPAAGNAAAAGITVHCVSMQLARQTTLDQVASMTGGKYYVTGSNKDNTSQQNFAELQEAFRDLASQIPIVLMD